MLFRYHVLVAAAALMLHLPNAAVACSSQTGIAPQEQSTSIDVVPQPSESRTEQTVEVADPVEPSISLLKLDDLEAFDPSRFAGPNQDEIVALITTSLSVPREIEATGSTALPNTATEWALDGLEDR
jgi:hypothetical protein